MVDDLVEHLNAQGYSADRLHGEMTQAMRDRVMNRFRKSGLEFLVATDVAARGIDVENIEVVFNYDLPYDGEDYVHRIGRTGRQGRSGRAISFASGREVFQIRNIERYTKTRIHRASPPTAAEVEQARANAVLDKIRVTLKSADFKPQEQLIGRLLEEGFSSTDIASALLYQLQAGEGGTSPREPREGSARAEERFDDRGTRARDHEPRSGYRPTPGARQPERPRRKLEMRPAQLPHRPGLEKNKAPVAKPRTIEPAPLNTAPAPRMEHPKAPAEEPEGKESPLPKASRRTPDDQTRLFMNLGTEMGVSKQDVVGAVSGLTGLPETIVGAVDLRERHLFFDVAADQANGVISKLNRAQIKGRKVKVKVA